LRAAEFTPEREFTVASILIAQLEVKQLQPVVYARVRARAQSAIAGNQGGK